MENYIAYHVHSHYSLLDSCTQFADYVALAKEYGQKAIASTEHGKPNGWVSKKMLCDKAGIKFIHGVEVYLTETLDEKIRDNYHTVLLAKNYAGVKELLALVSKSCNPNHFYYVNRVTFDEFLAISDNIISTSACLSSPLWKLPEDHPRYMELARKYTFLEVQPHDCQEQSDFNRKLLELSRKTGTPLIAGTDTHSANAYKAECRQVFMEYKNSVYEGESSFDMTYKSYDELVEMFRKQNALPEPVFLEAIANTNALSDMVEDFTLDTSIKYPILYGSCEADAEKLTSLVWQRLDEKLTSGVIPRSQEAAFRAALEEELRVFQKLGMMGFMLSMSELVSWCKAQGMAIGTARGSVGGSRVAYVSDITDLNPETWHTIFSRFCNEDRVEIGDIDIDCMDSDRPAIFAHITQKFGSRKTARVESFGTVQSKKVIEVVGKVLAQRWDAEHPGETDNPYSLKAVKRIKEEFDSNQDAAKRKYPDLFYYYDGLINTLDSQSVHPAGMVISPITLDDHYGTFEKDGDICLMLDMDEAHAVGLAKYDFLALKTVAVIWKTCQYLGQRYPQSHEVDWDDPDVWVSVYRDNALIFQFEGSFAAQLLRTFGAKSIFDMSLVTAALRPGGASYRDELIAHKVRKNPSKLIDDLLADNYGFLVYQEDTIKFLQQICGMSGSEADTIRRAIGHKDKEKLEAALPAILEGYCSKSDKPRAEAEADAKQFIQIIEDSASYQFGYNHSVAYCLLGYLCAWYRHYHPLEFITAFLNYAANDADIQNGTAYAESIGIHITRPKFGFAKSDYFYDAEHRAISKGVSSVKYLNASISDDLYDLAHRREYTYFMDVLEDIKRDCAIDSRQLNALIKLEYFSDFGNINECLRIYELFDSLKFGTAKSLSKKKLSPEMEAIVSHHATDKLKSGKPGASYTVTDMHGLMLDLERYVKEQSLPDFSLKMKMQAQKDYLSYIDLTTNRREDRRKLLILEVFPLRSKKDGTIWAYALTTRSIGTGKTARLTLRAYLYDRQPLRQMDTIFAKKVAEERSGYWYLYNYEMLI